jgi:AraC-like DNA-binding protein
MRENFQNGITVNDVADHLGVSPALLRLRFRTIHGKSAREILIETRIEKAKQLLLASDEPIGRIAQKIGFASSQRFSHCFAERLAMSPSDWRAAQRPPAVAT